MMIMKKDIKSLMQIGLIFLLSGMFACTDYLEQDTDSVLDDAAPFRTFYNFQSFTEELYSLVPSIIKHTWEPDFNWGEDILVSTEGVNKASSRIDRGDFRSLLENNDVFLHRNRALNPDDSDSWKGNHKKDIWRSSWYGIHKANHGLANLELLLGNQEEKDLIKGQLLFFRAWFHFQIMMYWGPMPYIDEVLATDEPLRLPRPVDAEVADVARKITQDFRDAADLLPIHWDDTATGEEKKDFNRWRINRIMALGYLAKSNLWYSSPLLKKTIEGSASGTYDYMEEFAIEAAAAASELLKYVDSGVTEVQLQPWEDMNGVFYSVRENWLAPGGIEAIFQASNYFAQNTGWSGARTWLSGQLTDNRYTFAPTANYVNYYGMENGLPIDHPESGFDADYPWRGRDARFYKDIVYDGVSLVEGSLSRRNEWMRHATLHTPPGISYPHSENHSSGYRDQTNGSRTGYLTMKLVPQGMNKWDQYWAMAVAVNHELSYMRLADIYLMYAEAAAVAYGGANGKHPDYDLTAVEAINVVRNRAGVGPVHSSFTGSLPVFMDEVRRERAVELAFEAHRFNDLRRWLLLDKHPYNVKTGIEFDRPTDFVLETETSTASKDNGVLNYREVVLVERQLAERHYWLPILVEDASLYEEFFQNPGW